MTHCQHKSAGQSFEQWFNGGRLIPMSEQSISDAKCRIGALSQFIGIEQNAAETQHILAALRQL